MSTAVNYWQQPRVSADRTDRRSESHTLHSWRKSWTEIQRPLARRFKTVINYFRICTAKLIIVIKLVFSQITQTPRIKSQIKYFHQLQRWV